MKKYPVSKEKRAEYEASRKRNMTPERRARKLATQLAWYHKVKSDPEWRKAKVARTKEYRRDPANKAKIALWAKAKKVDGKKWRRKWVAQANALRQKAKDVPCADCGVRYQWYVMDFHHTRDKKFLISSGRMRRMELLQLEIEKCVVLCSNCHRIRTFKEKHK